MAIKIPLNFMWADESVLLEDSQKKISETMVKWANAFFGQIDMKFELDVSPLYPLSIDRAKKYVLSKNGGVTPDLRTRAEILASETKEEERLNQQIDEKNKEVDELRKRESLLTELIDTIEREQDQLHERLEIATDPQERAAIKADLVRTRQEKASARASRDRVNAARDAALTILLPLWEQRHALWEKMDDRMEVISGDRVFRLQMALRYALEGIGSELRINVIFCRTKVSSGKYRVTGETRSPLYKKIEVLPGQFLLWPYSYIIIDLNPNQRKTLAHEIGHLPGRGHPAARVIYAGTKKLPLLSIGFPTFEEKPGGYFDGPENDIMNYTRADPEAKDTTMNIYDQVQLKYFLESLGKPLASANP
jgi:hypothetical protein